MDTSPSSSSASSSPRALLVDVGVNEFPCGDSLLSSALRPPASHAPEPPRFNRCGEALVPGDDGLSCACVEPADSMKRCQHCLDLLLWCAPEEVACCPTYGNYVHTECLGLRRALGD